MTDSKVVITLTGPEWAVALESLRRAAAHPDPAYQPCHLDALSRAIEKLSRATPAEPATESGPKPPSRP